TYAYPIARNAGIQLSWDTPLEFAAPVEQQCSFATNITPSSFNELPPLVDPPHLFPAPAEGTTGRRPAHSKKKPDNHIPRPPNAFILFRSSFIKSQHVSTEVETNHSTLSKIIGLTWQNLPNEERQVWHGKAKAALEDHKKRFPSYAFRPAHTRGKGGTEKRKVREVGLKDVKRCEKIAELLVEGKKGEELDAAIQEFDRTHVPEIVTRFEAPLTVRTYRRSSSAPAAEPEAKPFLRPSESPRAKRVARSASTQPTRLASPAVDLPPIALPPSNFFQISMDAGFAPSDFSFDQKIEPASFNFDNFFMDPPASPYDAPSPSSSMHSSFDAYSHPMQPCHPEPLSISTSFSQWQPPSPFDSTPSTPHMYASPYSHPCSAVQPEDTFASANFSLDPFEHLVDMSNQGYMSSEYGAVAKPQLAGQDVDFASFMSSLHPSYAI
ncbi:hypothetical protein HWV62_16880, partial [Athelia sp. TMB]